MIGGRWFCFGGEWAETVEEGDSRVARDAGRWPLCWEGKVGVAERSSGGPARMAELERWRAERG